MKTIKLFIAVASLALATFTKASEKPTLNVIHVEGEKVLVAYQNHESSKVSLSVKDSDGQIVYFKRTARPVADLRQLINLSGLEDGTYLFQVGVNSTKVSRKVTIAGDQVAISEPSYIIDPIVQVRNGLLDVTFLNQGQELITLKIFKGNELVYSSNLGDPFVIQKRYDMAKLPSGSYQIILETENQHFPFYANL